VQETTSKTTKNQETFAKRMIKTFEKLASMCKLSLDDPRCITDIHKNIFQELQRDFVMIPRVLLEDYMAILNDTDLRCLLYIALHTTGYHKNYDRISISQFVKGIQTVDEFGNTVQIDYGTGRCAYSVQLSLKKLEALKFIYRYRTFSPNGTNESYFFIPTKSNEIIIQALENKTLNRWHLNHLSYQELLSKATPQPEEKESVGECPATEQMNELLEKTENSIPQQITEEHEYQVLEPERKRYSQSEDTTLVYQEPTEQRLIDLQHIMENSLPKTLSLPKVTIASDDETMLTSTTRTEGFAKNRLREYLENFFTVLETRQIIKNYNFEVIDVGVKHTVNEYGADMLRYKLLSYLQAHKDDFYEDRKLDGMALSMAYSYNAPHYKKHDYKKVLDQFNKKKPSPEQLKSIIVNKWGVDQKAATRYFSEIDYEKLFQMYIKALNKTDLDNKAGYFVGLAKLGNKFYDANSAKYIKQTYDETNELAKRVDYIYPLCIIWNVDAGAMISETVGSDIHENIKVYIASLIRYKTSDGIYPERLVAKIKYTQKYYPEYLDSYRNQYPEMFKEILQ
jgi:hypothetical protein